MNLVDCNPPRNPSGKNPHKFGTNQAQAWKELQIAGEGLALALTRYRSSMETTEEDLAQMTCGECMFYQGEECVLNGAERYDDTVACADFVDLF